VFVGDQIVQAVQLAERDEQGQHHGKAAEDGPGDKVRREDGGVPTRDDRSGKVEGHDAVHGKHQRGGDTGQDQVGLLVVGPLTVGTAPTEGEDPVNHLAEAGLGAIAQGGEIGD